jgi:hypothetical protein
MKQTLLDRAVAHATGESLATIRHIGFGIVDPTTAPDDFDALLKPQTVNWDRLGAIRPGYLHQRTRLRRQSA